MVTIISVLLFLIFVFLSSIHIYWAFGGKWGRDAVFPTKDDLESSIMPGFVPTMIVAIGLLMMGVFVVNKTTLHFVELPFWIDKYGLWFIAGIFLIRGVGDFRYAGIFKKVRNTKFGINDTKYYTPLCFLIGSLTIIIAIMEMN